MDELKIEAAPDCDRYVHYWVMGQLERLRDCQDADEFPHIRNESVPFYSTDITAAWKALERFLPDNITIGHHYDICTNTRFWFCRIRTGLDNLDIAKEFQARAETAPHAICLAALAAAGVKMEPRDSAPGESAKIPPPDSY